MNLFTALNPFARVRAKKAPPGANLTARESAAQGPYTTMFSDYVPREVNPWLYEGLRETLPIIDGGIQRLCTLDGILRPEAETDALERAILDFMENVRVGDMDNGMQAFYTIAANEKYEQGFCVGEAVLAGDGKSVAQLVVADSKGIYFRRAQNGGMEVWYSPPAPKTGNGDTTQKMQRVLRNNYAGWSVNQIMQLGYRQLVKDRLFYAAVDVEAGNPYGTSKMRSLEFNGKTLLTMSNALQQTWGRFGDPSFELTYKTKARIAPTELDVRQKALADGLAKALDAKRGGNSMDFVNAVGRDDDLVLKVIGADNQVLEIEAPARHVVEQVLSKWGIPPWMFGIIWGTSERLADRQADMAIQDTRTRFENARPRLESIIAMHLRASGVTWSPGDWRLVQDLPNLKSEVESAQADFLRAQTQLMLSGARAGVDYQTPVTPGTGRAAPAGNAAPGEADAEAEKRYGFPALWTWARATQRAAASVAPHEHKAENYVENADALLALENRAHDALNAAWAELSAATLRVLGLTAKALKAPQAWVFDPLAMRAELLKLQDQFVAQFGAEDSALAAAQYDAWTLGIGAARAELGDDGITDAVRDRQREALRRRALEDVRNATVRSYRQDIVDALTDGGYDGQNPRDVARALAQRFAAHEYDWERLARTEIADAQTLGKEDQYVALGIEEYDWVDAGGSCPVCQGYAAGGPYRVGSGPRPPMSSHPMCRCTTSPRLE